MSETDVTTAVEFCEEDAEFYKLLSSTETALSFNLSEIEEMGKKARARKRAAKLAEQQQQQQQQQQQEELEQQELNEKLVSSISNENETDCEIPEVREERKSKIPILMKNHVSTSSKSKSETFSRKKSNSKIPKPITNIVYINRNLIENIQTTTEETSSSSSSESSSELTSFTGQETYPTCEMISGTENGLTCRDWVPPIPVCLLSTESDHSRHQNEEEDAENIEIVCEAKGVEVKFDMKALINGINMEIAGVKIE